ncbi:hypothetical protein HO173_011635 [Letharia columbiana]|uniref:Uncharacterized protein n=1 Tax=Letharia columbiana TaxID=112416 RepID=A0A8H6CSL2_9LECA|nr:uncharacterized protein HO173_011635 [Letharia columbiana]KAF6228788.1 hypothetical protein HO173_011635 [Letharia columbiana]
MHASRDMGQPTDNSNFENDEKSELQSQLRTGSVTVLDLASSTQDGASMLHSSVSA